MPRIILYAKAYPFLSLVLNKRQKSDATIIQWEMMNWLESL